MIPPARTTRARAPQHTPPVPPRPGDVVDVWWEGEGDYFRGVLLRDASAPRFTFLVAYDDGDRQTHDLDAEFWRYADSPDAPFPPGFCTEAWEHEPSRNKRRREDSDDDEMHIPRFAAEEQVSPRAVLVQPEPDEMVPFKVRFKRARARDGFLLGDGQFAR